MNAQRIAVDAARRCRWPGWRIPAPWGWRQCHPLTDPHSIRRDLTMHTTLDFGASPMPSGVTIRGPVICRSTNCPPLPRAASPSDSPQQFLQGEPRRAEIVGGGPDADAQFSHADPRPARQPSSLRGGNGPARRRTLARGVSRSPASAATSVLVSPHRLCL